MVVKCKSYDIAPSTDIDLGLHICNCGNRDALFGDEFDIALLSFRAANTHEVIEPDVLKGLLLKKYLLSFRAANTHEVIEPDVLKGLLLKKYTNPLSSSTAVSIGV